MEAQDRQIETMRSSFAAVLRLRKGMKDYPHASAGLGRLAHMHVRRLAALSAELCRPSAATLPCEDDRQALAG